jgi:peptidoglycan/xylan/chitin deacetylase (PgdA/CDA1 family)
MRFLSKHFLKIYVSRLPQLLLIISSTFIILGCGGSNSTSIPQVNEEKVDQPSIALNETFLGTSYNLVALDDYQNSALQAYWPSDSEIPVAVQTSLQSVLLQVNNRFKEHNFAFSRLSAEEMTPRYKKLFFSPKASSDENSTTQLNVIRADERSFSVTYDINSVLNATELSFKLTQAVYQGERSQYQLSTEDSVFERIVSRGLVLHFINNNLVEGEFSVPVSIDPSALNVALAKLKEELNDDSLIDTWFTEQPLNEQQTTNAVGYYLVAQHFSYYPGSNASNSFSVNSKLFLPWLDGPDHSTKKAQQYVRTSDVPDQIAVSELSRQAGLFEGHYFIEGLNHEKLIALSFDDGPSQYTSQILDVLEQAQVPASFFWQGQSLANYQAVIERSIKAGHTVANHSWNHDNGMSYTADELWENQVAKTNDEFQQLFNIMPRFYRPPYGEISDAQVEFLAEKGMKVLLWSVDSRDWNPELNSVAQIESELINHQHEEVITLMHDAGGNRQNTVDSLPAIIEHYKAQGYRFVNLETLLGISDKH